jgi:hypothetical protein
MTIKVQAANLENKNDYAKYFRSYFRKLLK